MRTTPLIVAALLIATAACSSDESTTTTLEPSSSTTTVVESTAAPTTSLPATSAPTTSSPATTGPETTAPSTSGVVTSTTVACEFDGDTGDEQDGFPERMSSMVGVDIRTGGHGCYERVVIEFAESGDPVPVWMPGWWVRYADGPVTLGESDETVDLAGDATLLITTAAWMPNMEGTGYDGPTRFVPDNVTHLLEMRQVYNWEGYSTWAVGLDRERPFRVFTLTQPSRLVVDIGI